MFGQVVKQWFWDTYDHLGRLLVLNLLLVLLAGPVLFYASAFLLSFATAMGHPSGTVALAVGAFVLCAVSTTLVWSGLLWFGFRVSQEKDPSVREFLRGIAKRGRRVGAVVFAGGFAATILAANMWWYFFSGRVEGAWRLPGYFLGGLSLWLLLILAGVLLHALPIAVRTEHSWLRCLKLGTLATLKYPVLTLTVLLFIAGFLIVGTLLKLAGLLVYGFVLPAMVANSLHDVVSMVESAASRGKAERSERPASWREIERVEGEEEEERLRKARYDRGWGDLLRPWEM